MTIEEIKSLDIDKLEERIQELRGVNVDSLNKEECDAFDKEIDAVELRKAELLAIAKEKQEKRDAILNEEVATTKIEKPEEIQGEKRMEKFGIESNEYRDAFYAMLSGNATAEQRTIFADGSAYGDGASLPVGLDTKIWDQIVTNHPIMADIDRIAFGTAIKVTQATPAGTSKKKDSDAITEMSVTFDDVTLAGADYLAVVRLSYAEARMSVGAMEKYIANAVVEQVGEAMAKDVFARILTDASANSTTKATGDTYFKAINTALGKAKGANNPVIYAPSTLYYAILGECDSNGQPIVRDGVVLGAQLKKDNAATKITIVDPKQFVLDEIQSVTLKVQDRVENGGYVYGAYARAEGCLRRTDAAAFIA